MENKHQNKTSRIGLLGISTRKVYVCLPTNGCEYTQKACRGQNRSRRGSRGRRGRGSQGGRSVCAWRAWTAGSRRVFVKERPLQDFWRRTESSNQQPEHSAVRPLQRPCSTSHRRPHEGRRARRQPREKGQPGEGGVSSPKARELGPGALSCPGRPSSTTKGTGRS